MSSVGYWCLDYFIMLNEKDEFIYHEMVTGSAYGGQS